MVSVYLYTLCGLACPPVSSAVHVGWGGRAEATAEAACWPSPASQPLVTGRYSVTKNFHSNQNTVHHIMLHTYGSFVWQQNVSGYWVVPWPLWPRTLVMVVSGVWSVESLPQRPLRPEEAGPAPVPVTSLCSVLPPSSPSPSVTTGHQEDMVRTSDQHQQGNNSVINYTQPAPASREPDVTHHWPGAPHDSSSSLSSSLSLLQCSFCGKAREHDDIWGEVFPSIIGSVYQSVWLVVMFAPIPLSLIFIKLFWAHSQKIKNEHFLMEMYILYFWL